MRASSTVVIVLVAAPCLLVGCSQTTTPTSPTSALSTMAAVTSSSTAVHAASTEQVPFKGRFEGSDAVIPPATIKTSATGNGTLVGQLTLTNVLTVTSPSGGPGTGHWIAANGDSIDTTFVASAEPAGDVLSAREDHIIIGGTGRFSSAQGTFTVHRIHVFAPSADGTHVTSGSFEGTITSPSAAH